MELDKLYRARHKISVNEKGCTRFVINLKNVTELSYDNRRRQSMGTKVLFKKKRQRRMNYFSLHKDVDIVTTNRKKKMPSKFSRVRRRWE